MKLQILNEELFMPKMKTHKGTVKRFRFTGSGKPVQSQGRKGHFRRRKAGRLLQQLDKLKLVDDGNKRMIALAMPYGNKHSR
jgi:large subunit ribosomal protein L35